MYDVYEVPMYHNGTFAKNPESGKIVAFISENTGRRYPLKRLEPESMIDVSLLWEHDSDFREHLYAEDMVITHEISGDVDEDGFCEAAWLDGKPLSDYQLTADFVLSIEDTIVQEYMNEEA